MYGIYFLLNRFNLHTTVFLKHTRT